MKIRMRYHKFIFYGIVENVLNGMDFHDVKDAVIF